MPCFHSIRQDAGLVSGGASTSSRCEQTASLQRVSQAKVSARQLQRHLRRSQTAVKTALKQCQIHAQQGVSPIDQSCAAQLDWEQGQSGGRAYDSRCIGRCLLQGFAFAAMFSLLTPEGSYAAESLPIGLVKSWLVSILACSRVWVF